MAEPSVQEIKENDCFLFLHLLLLYYARIVRVICVAIREAPQADFAPHRLRLWGVFVYPFPLIISLIFIDIIQEGFFMIVVLKPGVTKENRTQLMGWLQNLGLTIHVSEGEF